MWIGLISRCRIFAIAATLALAFEGIIWIEETLRIQVRLVACVLFAPCGPPYY